MMPAKQAIEAIEAIDARMKAHANILPVCRKCGSRMPGKTCLVCADVETSQQRALTDKWARDVARLGGLKAAKEFTQESFFNKTAIELCAGFPGENLFIWGLVGTGKTHLATALARPHPEARVVKPQAIFRECRGLLTPAEEQNTLNSFIHIPYLVIDDLGMGRITDFSFSVLYEIIDGRDMNLKTGLIITSNLSLNALAERMGDDRITSRISGLCKIVHLTGKDWRLNEKKKSEW